MRNLLEFLQNHFHWVLFVVLEALSGILLFQYNSYQNSVWFMSANWATGKVYEWSSWMESFFSMSTNNEDMQMDGPSWLSFLAERVKDINVTDWIRIQKMGWCTETTAGMFRVNPDKINYYLTALRFETNIRGVL